MSTITTILATDTLADSRAVINANFANLNADKVETLGDFGVTVSTAEINRLDGVTDNVQDQLDTKASSITGEVRTFALSSAPSGWLVCDGSEISRTTYADLFTAIGTAFGVGNGSTTFNIPDIRGRVIAGLDNQGGSSADVVTATEADSLGGEYGSEEHTLTTDEMPAHTHDVANVVKSTPDSNEYGGADRGEAGTRTSASTGGGSAHNNMQPTIFLLVCIKT